MTHTAYGRVMDLMVQQLLRDPLDPASDADLVVVIRLEKWFQNVGLLVSTGIGSAPLVDLIVFYRFRTDFCRLIQQFYSRDAGQLTRVNRIS
jgi:hypothetical protein